MQRHLVHGIPGHVATELMKLDGAGTLDAMRSMNTMELGAEVMKATMRTLAIACIALDVRTEQIVGAEDALQDAIDSMGGDAWPSPKGSDPSS